MGNVFGPATSTDNAIARWDGVTGTLLKNSTVLVNDVSPNVQIAEIDNAHIAQQITTASASGMTVSQFVVRNPGGDRMFEINLGANITTQTFDKLSFVTPASTGLGIWAAASSGEDAYVNLYSGVAGSDFFRRAHIATGAGNTTLLDQARSGVLYVNSPGGVIVVAGDAAGIIRLATGGTATTNERARIDSSGLVGINTTTPGAQTHIVSGAAARVGLIIDSAASASVDIAQFRNNASATVQFAVKQDGMFTYPGNTTNAAQFDKTSDAAFATVTGLSVPVRAGRTYVFRAVLEITCGAVGGFQIRINGTATATSVQWTSVLFRDVGGTPPVLRFVTRATALATTQGDTGFTSYYLVLDGVIVVNAAGNLDVQFAQAVSNATTSSVFANCSWQVTEKQ